MKDCVLNNSAKECETSEINSYDSFEEEYESPKIESYEEDDAWTFAPCGGD